MKACRVVLRRASGVAVFSALRNACDALASVVFPAPCLICDRIMDTASRDSDLPEHAWNRFRNCRRRFAFDVDVRLFRRVTARISRDAMPSVPIGVFDFDLARSFALYDEQWCERYLMLKHQGIAPLGVWFAKRIAGNYREHPKMCGR